MSPRDDDVYEMSSDQVTGGPADTARPRSTDGTSVDGTDMDGIEGSELVTQFLAELRQFADEPAPPPSAELAALLGGATPIQFGAARKGSKGRHRRNVAVVTMVSVAALSATGVAAANDSLPQPAQRVVTSVVNDLTPFHINPEPLHPSRAVIVPPDATHSPEPDEHGPSPAGSPEPAESRSSGPESGDGSSGGDTEGGTGSGEHGSGPSTQPGSDSESDGHSAPASGGDSGEAGDSHTESRTNRSSTQSSPAPTSDREHDSESSHPHD